MSGNSIKPGPTSEIVRANIRCLRRARQLTLAQVSARLAETGRPMAVTVISKVERGERRIDADDLVAFAEVFGIAPARLLTAPACDKCHDAPKPWTRCLACGKEAQR